MPDIDGLIKYVRERNAKHPPELVTSGTACILADEIERLRDEVCKLDSILGEIGYWCSHEKE